MLHRLVGAICLVSITTAGLAQSPALSPAVREFVSVADPVFALTHAEVIDGTGAPPKRDQNIVVRDRMIAAVGDTASTTVPPNARVIDLTGRTVLPGLVMVHEHLYYPVGGSPYNYLPYSFPRLYLAGGVTTMRTAGSMSPYADLNLRRAIDAGERPGPKMDITGPYLNGPGVPLLEARVLKDADDARRLVRLWAAEGATSFKAYAHITRAELKAAIEEAHRRGLKVTGHLCSVTFNEAIDLGIDSLEHGAIVASDFVTNKRPDECPPLPDLLKAFAQVDISGSVVQTLIRKLVDRRVAVSSTLPVMETTVPARTASDRALEVLLPELREHYHRTRQRVDADTSMPWLTVFKKEMEFERAFVRAGGLLAAGTDPAGYGGVIAGFANQRAIELLVEAGFTPVEAIHIATHNGARMLGRADHVGTVAVGKYADLVVVRGQPATKVEDIEQVETVFKDGIGYDSQKLIASVRGVVGLR
jgi:imidazolonepropionase-like amidohydrolase